MKQLFGLVMIMAAMVGCGDSDQRNYGRDQYGQVPCWNSGTYSTNCQGLYAYNGHYDQRNWRPYSYWNNGGQQYFSPHYSDNWHSYYQGTSGQGYGAAYANGAWSNPYGFSGCSSYPGYAPVYLNSGVACYHVGTNPYQLQNYHWQHVSGSEQYANQYTYEGYNQTYYDGMLKGCGGDNGVCETGRCSSARDLGVCLAQ